MNKYLTLIFILFSAKIAAACDLRAGEYKIVTESEWGVNLTVVKNNKFTLTWWGYISGVPDSTEYKSYSGEWQCIEGGYTFKYELETVSAEYRKSKDYPFGVYKDSKAIVFSGLPDNDKYLAGYTFWPKNWY